MAVRPRSDPLLAGNPGPLTGAGTNTWLIDGAQPALIDAGVGHASHIDAIARALEPRALAHVFVTHGHPDHASGVAALRARWPDLDAAKCFVHAAAAGGWRPLHDGDRIPAGDDDLEVIRTPGHAADHVCFWDAARRDLYSGDMVFLGTSAFVAPSYAGGHLRSYLSSLERMAALKPARLLPGHGPVIDRPAEIIEQYLTHRREREVQVKQCFEDGVRDLDAVVARIYPELAEGLRRAARLTVEAHVEKLREDGYPVPDAMLSGARGQDNGVE
jgi:glyoxylase-like metal-dependent hydrolase (beta-lactamase superfamily II)